MGSGDQGIGMLANFLGAMAKGKGQQGGPGTAHHQQQQQQQQPPEQHQTTPQAEAPVASEPAIDQQIQELLEMGLVEDAGLARDMLMANGGDISAVVSMLCKD